MKINTSNIKNEIQTSTETKKDKYRKMFLKRMAAKKMIGKHSKNENMTVTTTSLEFQFENI